METDRRLAPLSEIKMKVSLGLFSDATTDIFARIVDSFERDGKFYSGMEFTFVDQEGQQAIKRLVDQLVLAV